MLETLTDKELELKRSVQEALQTQGVLAKLKVRDNWIVPLVRIVIFSFTILG